MLRAIEAMNDLLGSDYEIVASEGADPVVLAKLPGENLARNAENSQMPTPTQTETPEEPFSLQPTEKNKTTDDYLFQFYIGSLTVVGLFVLFRMIQKSR